MALTTGHILGSQRVTPPIRRQQWELLESAMDGMEYPENKKSSNSYLGRKWADLKYGARYVDSQYLELFWKYNFQQVLVPWLIPLVILLVVSQVLSSDIGSITFDLLKYGLTIVFLLASALGSVLQLPFDIMRWLISLTPAIVVPILDLLPGRIAIKMVEYLLELHSSLNYVSQTFLLSVVSAVLWRPMIEEVQYRYLLGSFLGKRRRKTTRPVEEVPQESDDTHLVKFISIEGAEGSDAETTPRVGKSKSSKQDLEPLSGSSSRRLFLSSIIFAMTRLGWLCASAGTVDFSYRYAQAAISPYSWTTAFVQSTLAHLSSQVSSELSPFFQRSLLLLAVQQTVSTFLMTWNVFVPLYETRGIAASIGAHMAWTFGKITLPVRLLCKIAILSRTTGMHKISEAE